MSLKKSLLAALAITAATIGAPRAEQVELVVQYTQPQIFDGVFERLKAEFEAQNPGITVTYRAPLPNYGAGVQALLREATVGDMPHVDYLGLSHLKTVVDRDLAVGIGELMAKDGETFEENGWTESLQSLGRIDGEQYALPFAVSMSVAYYNADLVR
ncbi:MAG: extracellular solute-binding protein, partial [Pseudomonadota bacterium]